MTANNDVDLNWGPDVGFAEADIIASIEEAAHGHAKWIYDCLIARLGNDVALRLSQAKRAELMERSVDIYSGYWMSVLKDSKKGLRK